MQAHAIPGPWAAGERVLVCVSEDPRAPRLVRYAKRLADRLTRPWTALHVETGRSLQLSRGGARPHRRHAAAGRAAGRRDGHAAGPTTSPTTIVGYARKPTTSPTSSSASRRARAGSSCCTARWSHELIRAAAAISACTSSPARSASQPRPHERPRTAAEPSGFDLWPYALPCSPWRSRYWRRQRAALALCSASRTSPSSSSRRSSASPCAVRPVAVAARRVAQRLWLQFLLPAAALHLHHRRSRERRRAVLLRGRRRGDRQQSRRARARRRRSRAAAGAHHRGALRVQPQAGRRRHARRSAVGDAPTRSPRC